RTAAVGHIDMTNCTFYQCSMCGKTYSWKSSYHRHLREECGKQQRVKCKNCGRQYRWRDSLNKHLKYECGVEPKYMCSACGRKFRHKQLLTSHLRKFHLNHSKRDHNRVNYDAPFTCYKCGKRYTWTDSLTRHLREGCGKLPRHKCTLCGRKFKRRDYLLRHENNVHKAEKCIVLSAYCGSDYYKRLGRHFCSNCGKEYRWMQSLVRHEREECGKEPQHSCPVCGMKIRHRWMLKKHLINVHHWVISNGKNVHLGLNDGLPIFVFRSSYLCNNCGKTYKWKESLNLHKRMECGIEPRFCCKVCGRRFKHKHHLAKHHKSIHNYVDLPVLGASF
ncbi:unnamed protein product, partial [Heterotrigona itama]